LPSEPPWEDLLAPLEPATVGPFLPARERFPARETIASSLASSGLAAFLRDAGEDAPLTLVINDPQRPPAPRPALEAILGMADRLRLRPRLRLLVATGSHRFTAEERRRHEEAFLGPWSARFVERAWHDARSEADLAPIGPHRLHRFIAEGPRALAIGSLEPHYFAGVTGAHKALTIGVMALGDLTANHEAALEPRAAPLALEGNPVFEGAAATLAALERSGHSLFAVDLIQAGGRVLGCTAGPPLRALREGLPRVRRTFARQVPAPLDLVVSRVAPPLDRSLYQADKGIKNVEGAVRDGGVILLDAACHDGLGIDRFVRLLERAPDHASVLALVRREGYALGDHKAVRLRRLTDVRGVRIGIVSRALADTDARVLHAARFDDRAAAARWALGALGARRTRARDRGGALIVQDAGQVILESAGGRDGSQPRAAASSGSPGTR